MRLSYKLYKVVKLLRSLVYKLHKPLALSLSLRSALSAYRSDEVSASCTPTKGFWSECALSTALQYKGQTRPAQNCTYFNRVRSERDISSTAHQLVYGVIQRELELRTEIIRITVTNSVSD